MFNSRFLWYSWAILATTVIACTALFSYIISDQINRDSRGNVQRSLEAQENLLAKSVAPLLQIPEPERSAKLFALIDGLPIRVTVIDDKGQVLADNRKAARRMDNHSGRAEIVAANSVQYGVSARFSDTLKQQMLYVATKLRSQNKIQGYLRVAVPLTFIDKQVTGLQEQLFRVAFVLGFAFLFIGYFVARQLVKPISEITAVAEQMSQGNYALRLPVDRMDELGKLALAYNHLAAGTETRIDELVDSRNHLAAVLAGLTEGIVAVDIEQKILHMNDAAANMLGVNQEQVILKPLLEDPLTKRLSELVGTAIEQATSVNATQVINDASLDFHVLPLFSEEQRGEGQRGEVQGSAGHARGKKVTGAIVVIQDVTDILYLEQVRRDFVANASHELKTPISAIRGFLETIIDDNEMPADVLQSFLGRARNQLIRLHKIVQDLISISRFDSPQGEMEFQQVDIDQLLRAICKEKLEDAALAKVALDLKIVDEHLKVDGDEQSLFQMLANLVDNAIKYSDQNSSIKLIVEKSVGTVLISVQDEGIGIKSDDQQRIFERFYRVDPARSRDKGGTGLGLSIVKHIAQSHGGSVVVESHIDRGSRFTVSLPLVKDS